LATNKIICDTDVIVDYWDISKPRHFATKNAIDNVIGLNNILISVITQIELLIGAVNKIELSKFNHSFQRFGIVNIDNATSIFAVRLINEYTLSHGLALPDALIAASSILSGKELFTYNTKDYKFIGGLTVFKL
jgi:predicted nucleic acid-binding protein